MKNNPLIYFAIKFLNKIYFHAYLTRSLEYKEIHIHFSNPIFNCTIECSVNKHKIIFIFNYKLVTPTSYI